MIISIVTGTLCDYGTYCKTISHIMKAEEVWSFAGDLKLAFVSNMKTVQI
jgi:hypothetical protein